MSTLGLLTIAACDRDAPAPTSSPATGPAPRRIALLAVPLTAEVPPGWDVRRGPGGALVLSGRAPSGDREVAMSVGAPVPTADVPATQPATPTAPGGPVTVRVDDRDGMRIVERIERAGRLDEPAEVAPLRWTIRYVVVGDGFAQPAYDLAVTDLTQLTFERDETFLRAIFDTVRPAAAP